MRTCILAHPGSTRRCGALFTSISGHMTLSPHPALRMPATPQVSLPLEARPHNCIWNNVLCFGRRPSVIGPKDALQCFVQQLQCGMGQLMCLPHQRWTSWKQSMLAEAGGFMSVGVLTGSTRGVHSESSQKIQNICICAVSLQFADAQVINCIEKNFMSACSACVL